MMKKKEEEEFLEKRLETEKETGLGRGLGGQEKAGGENTKEKAGREDDGIFL